MRVAGRVGGGTIAGAVAVMVVTAGVMCNSEQAIDISSSLNDSRAGGSGRWMLRFSFRQGRPKTGQFRAMGVGARLSTRTVVMMVMTVVAVLWGSRVSGYRKPGVRRGGGGIHGGGDRAGGHGLLRDAEEGAAEGSCGGTEVDERGEDFVAFSVVAVSKSRESAEEKEGNATEVHDGN